MEKLPLRSFWPQASKHTPSNTHGILLYTLAAGTSHLPAPGDVGLYAGLVGL